MGQSLGEHPLSKKIHPFVEKPIPCGLAVAVIGKFPTRKRLEVAIHPNWVWWAALVGSKTLPGTKGPLRTKFLVVFEVPLSVLVGRRLATRNVAPAVAKVGFIWLGFSGGCLAKAAKTFLRFRFCNGKGYESGSFLPVNQRSCETSRFVTTLPGFPRSLGIALRSLLLAAVAPAPRRWRCLPRPAASNIPAVFFLLPGKAKAPNVPTRKIRVFGFNMSVALAEKDGSACSRLPWERDAFLLPPLQGRCSLFEGLWWGLINLSSSLPRVARLRVSG